MKPVNLLRPAALLLLQCLLTSFLFAQAKPLPKQWDKTFGGENNDYLSSVQQTKDGGYILGGYTFRYIWDYETFYKYWIVKTDANGNKLWDRYYEDSRFDGYTLTCLQQTTDGGYILGGYGTFFGGQNYQWDFAYWVVKTDARGIMQWNKYFDGIDFEYLTCIQQTTDGGYILGGYSNSDSGIDKSEHSRGGYDYWIIKIDAAGNKLWDKRFGGTGWDYLYSIQQTKDGGYILGGNAGSGIGGDKTEDSRGWDDYWIVKTDAAGNKEWDKRFGGNGADNLYSIQETNDSGYILGGYSGSGTGGDKTEDSRGQTDYWIVKTDAAGNKEWDKRFGGDYEDELRSTKQTNDGGYILGGDSYSGVNGDKTEETRGVNDYWIIKTDAVGNKEWDKRLGGSNYDRFSSLQQTKDGGYILGGYSQSGISGDKSEETRGVNDYWIVKIGCPPASTIQASGSLDICQTGSVKLSVASTDTLRYRWIKSNRVLKDSKDNTYIVTEPGTYRVIVFYGVDCSALSDSVTVSNSCVKNVTNDVFVSPNPSGGFVTVTYKSNSTTSIALKVYDKTGRLLYNKTDGALAGDNVYQLNLSNLLPGTYNLQLVNGSESKNAKLIIQK